MTDLPETRRWPDDRGGEWHLIRRYVGEVAEALCRQSVPIASLGEGDGPQCYPCWLNHGRELADRQATAAFEALRAVRAGHPGCRTEWLPE